MSRLADLEVAADFALQPTRCGAEVA